MLNASSKRLILIASLVLAMPLLAAVITSYPIACSEDNEKYTQKATTEKSPLSVETTGILADKEANSTQQEQKQGSITSTFFSSLCGWFFRLIHDPINIITSIIACFTIGLYLTGRNTAKRQLRAYLTTSDINIALDPRDPGVLVTDIYIKNCGQTPAYEVRGWIKCELIESTRIPEFLTPANDNMSQWNLGAGDIKCFRVPRTQLTQEEYIGVRDRKYMFYAWGRVDYRDIFKSRWWVNFRMALKIRTDGTPPVWLEIDKEGNDAT